MYDVIIIGARCAGSATARLLARQGKRVLLVDRAQFPSDTISGHFIMHPGTRKLAEWGLLHRVIATGCPPVTRATSNFGDYTLVTDLPSPDGVPACIGPRRLDLDQVLLDSAIEAGAEFRPGCSLVSLVFEGDRVVGARFRSGTNEFEERAALVVGADGKNSLVARLVQAPVYNEVPSLTCWYMGYWKDLPADGLEAHWSANRVALVFPTNGGLTLIAVGWKHERFGEVRTDIDNHYRAAVADMVALRERFGDATLVGQYSGMGDLPNFFRKPYGPGWALVGDAGHHKDPMNAKGISDAFEDAELLASAIDAGLSGREPMEESLAGYHSARDARAVPDSEFNMMRARLETWGSPEMLGLRAAVRGDVENARELYKAILGMSPWQQFFAPENLGRIIAGAQAAAAAR